MKNILLKLLKTKVLPLLLVAVLAVTALPFAVSAERNLIISPVNIPDANFRSYILDNFDKNGDKQLSEAEVAAVTEMDISLKRISDLTGIKYFTALKVLDCSFNSLTALDTSANTSLVKLTCSYNDLVLLNVSKNALLAELYCIDNELTELDVSQNTALEQLFCNHNKLTVLDVSNNTELKGLDCSGNKLSCLDAMACTKLTILNCTSNTFAVSIDPFRRFDLTTLPVVPKAARSTDFVGGTVDVRGMLRFSQTSDTFTYTYNVANGFNAVFTLVADIPLEQQTAINSANFPDKAFRTYIKENLDANGNNYLSEAEIAAVTKLLILEEGIADLTGIELFGALEYLDCAYNNLTSLDVSKNTALTYLRCTENNLETLITGNNPLLENLDAAINNLTAIDLSGNTGLSVLNLTDNKFASIDVSKNTALTVLILDYMELTTLDVSNNTELTLLSCSRNYLTSLDLSANTKITELYCIGNEYEVEIDTSRTFDLNSLPAVLDLSKLTPVSGGAINAASKVLTFDGESDIFIYNYSLSNGYYATFAIAIKPPVLLGDINGDGEINNIDAALALKYDAGIIDIVGDGLKAGDVNGDGEVNNIDAALILKYDAGIIDEF